MSDLIIPRETFKKLFEACDGGGLEYDDFIEWMADELDERLEACDIESEVVLT